MSPPPLPSISPGARSESGIAPGSGAPCRIGLLLGFAALLFTLGCDPREGGPEGSATADAQGPEGSAAAAPGPEILDREFIFLSADADTSTTVALLFRARPGGDRVFREWAAWGARNGRWEVLVEEERVTPRAGTPWRVLPSERIALTVGSGDRVSSIGLRDPGRGLDLEIEELLTEWTGPGGRTARLQRGQVALATGTEAGFVMEVARSWEDQGPGPGDWLFLHAGDRLQLFLAEETPLGDDRSSSSYTGWSRIATRDGQWPRVQVEWIDTRSFESARREIPVRWRLASPGEEIVGELQAASQHLLAHPGRGPLLPVFALYEVTGSLQVEGERFQVRGIVNHRQR